MNLPYNFHATAVAIKGKGVIIIGPSGSGKSDLALRLIDRGAALIADDRVVPTVRAGDIYLSPPATIRGLLEVRGVGIVNCAFTSDVKGELVVDLSKAPERMPEKTNYPVLGVPLPKIFLNAFEISAAIKVEWALSNIDYIG